MFKLGRAVFITFFFIALFNGSRAQAQETAAVLPPGFFRVREVSVFGATVTSLRNDAGQSQDLLRRLNVQVSAAQLAAKNDKLKELYTKLNTFEKGLGDTLLNSEVRAEGQLSFQRHLVALEYGLRPGWNLGIIVPIVHLRVDSDVSVNTNFAGTALKRRLRGISPAVAGINLAAESVAKTEFVKSFFTDRGYLPPQGMDVTALGEIELGAKYQFYKEDASMAALKMGFRLPTAGHMADQRQLLDRSTGDGQTDFGVQLSAENQVSPNWVVEASSQLTYQMPGHRQMAVLAPGESGIPELNRPELQENVRFDLGPILDLEASSTYYFAGKTIYGYGAYQFSAKGQDRYSGAKNLDYASLEKETHSLSHRYEIGAGYSTVPLVIKKKFAVPFEVKVAWNDLIYGRNVPDARFARMDLIVYF